MRPFLNWSGERSARAAGTDLDRAYRWCAAHRVAATMRISRSPRCCCPRRMRPAIAAIYAFARRADDFADEPGPTDAERLALLDDWHRRARWPDPRVGPMLTDLIFLALDDAIGRHRLPRELVRGFAQRVPSGRLDAAICDVGAGAGLLPAIGEPGRPARAARRRVTTSGTSTERSDALCTALQLTNFWQDFGVDWRRGRLYLPLDDYARAGADEAGSRRPDGGRRRGRTRSTPPSTRTRELFARGRPICDAVPGPPALGAAPDLARRLAGSRSSAGFPGRPEPSAAAHAPGYASPGRASGRLAALEGRRAERLVGPHTTSVAALQDRHSIDAKRHEFLLLVPRPAGPQASGDRRRVGLLPRR